MTPKNNTVSSWKVIENNTAVDSLLDINREVTVEQPAPKTYNSSVKLQSMVDARLLYDGRTSGKHYEWQRAGSVQVVDDLDAPDLLSKRIKTQSCCSGSDVAVFQQVD